MKEYKINFSKSDERMRSSYYQIPNIFSGVSPDWPGDFEGRSLLAYCSLYSVTGEKNPSMDLLMDSLEKVTNEDGYFGNIQKEGNFDEQQLSGNSWFLRGLIEYYKLFNSQKALDYANKVVNNLFVPYLKAIGNYPIDREKSTKGKVDGFIVEELNGWRLSTDVICAFMPLDSLGHYYEINPNDEFLKLLDNGIEKYMSIDKVKIKAQTHATLAAARGILKVYKANKQEKYLNYAISIFDLYVNKGMTKNYENYNWFNRKEYDIWTEPCCVTDSLILAIELFNVTKDIKYKTLAQRIWFNGMQFCLRNNGGCGTNYCVDDDQIYLKFHGFEASQCCSMRYSEGLKYFNDNLDLFKEDNEEIYEEDNRIFKGNHLLVKDINNTFKKHKHYEYKGMSLIEIPTLANVPFIAIGLVKLQVIFKNL